MAMTYPDHGTFSGRGAGQAPERELGRNTFFLNLSTDAEDAVLQSCRPRELEAGEVLRGGDEPVLAICFVRRGLISLLGSEGGQPLVEVASAGRGEIVGLRAVFGSDRPGLTAVALSDCTVDEVHAETFAELCQKHPELRSAVLLHARKRLEQIMRRSACHSRHPLQKRLARWLLEMTDKLASDDVAVRHHQLAVALGVRRASITETLHLLEGKGAIRNSRCRLRIRDAARLRELSCGCDHTGRSH